MEAGVWNVPGLVGKGNIHVYLMCWAWKWQIDWGSMFDDFLMFCIRVLVVW